MAFFIYFSVFCIFFDLYNCDGHYYSYNWFKHACIEVLILVFFTFFFSRVVPKKETKCRISSFFCCIHWPSIMLSSYSHHSFFTVILHGQLPVWDSVWEGAYTVINLSRPFRISTTHAMVKNGFLEGDPPPHGVALLQAPIRCLIHVIAHVKRQ